MKKKIVFIMAFLGILFGFIGIAISFKFQNISLEFGDKQIIQSNTVRYGSKSNFKIDSSKVDFNHVGEYPVTINYYGIKLHKTVTIADTTAPKLETTDVYKDLNYQINIDDFVLNKDDYSEVKVSYDTDADTSKYGIYDVSVNAVDAYGNKTTNKTKLYISWVKLDYELEVGDTLKIKDLVFSDADKSTVNQKEIDFINSSDEGVYYLKSTREGVDLDIKITKNEDKTPPELVLKNVTLYEGKKIKDVKDFVVKATDKAGSVSLKLLTTINYKKIGEQSIEIEAIDNNNNRVVKNTKLKIVKDNEGPEFKGLSKLTVKKNKTINYNKGVSAHDKNFGQTEFTVDSSKVDVTKYGTYYAYYTSVDKLNNKTTAKRVIFVEHDSSDTKDLVKKVAATLSSDPEAIRDYVRNKIKYNANAGGSDPTWYGLTNKYGNCKVHAYVFDALLKEKGYTTKIIWVKDKSHYWNMLILNGKWVHMDSTPGRLHTKYSIMNDTLRYQELQGRDWDRSLWPKAE